jgi:hypothetical protein
VVASSYGKAKAETLALFFALKRLNSPRLTPLPYVDDRKTTQGWYDPRQMMHASTNIDLNPRGRLMNNEIPLKFYDITDEYATESEKPVSESERDALARYFQLLLTRLMNNEEISEDAQKEMASEAGIDELRIDEIATFLNQWGNE